MNFHEAGARMLTLTWNYENELGHPAAMQGDHWKNYRANEKRPLGLKERGFEFVAEMERLGMIVDASHLSDDGFFDLCRACDKAICCEPFQFPRDVWSQEKSDG